jgi:hypothetical protein
MNIFRKLACPGQGIRPPKIYIYAEQHKHRKNSGKYSCTNWDSNPRSQFPCGGRYYDVRVLDWTATITDSSLALIQNLVRNQRLRKRYHNWLVCNQKPVLEWAVHGPKLSIFCWSYGECWYTMNFKTAQDHLFQIPSHTPYLPGMGNCFRRGVNLTILKWPWMGRTCHTK